MPGTVVAGRFARDAQHFVVKRTDRPHPGIDSDPSSATEATQRPYLWQVRPDDAPTVSPELKALLRRVKLGRCLDTLPERLALAQTGGMGHAEFLELVLADEVTRRETTSADRRARAAGLDATMTLDRWDDSANVTYDRAIWNELCSLRFVDSGHNAVIMGPVGVGKTFLATALGTPPSGAATACTSNAATCCSRGCAPAGSTTATTSRCANCCVSTC